ncbi:homoserine O-acetyltransferase [Stemphylium lycopersici]|nr:homoserine O-acetyltransferase [Stemphylium lycopersici]
MASPAADPKAAPLADELKDLALSLPTTAFPKNFFCALCNQLAFDSYKLICCAKSVCPSCQANFQFPTTCPLCDHSPLEADSCTVNKSLRNTMRVWLQKQKKKEEAKAAAQAATPPVEVTPTAPEVQPIGEGIDKPVDSVEEPPKAEDVAAEEAAGSTEKAEEAGQRAGSVSAQPNEDNTSLDNEAERRGSTTSQNVSKSTEPAAAEGTTEEQNNANGANGIAGNSSMMNNMQGQMGFGFQNQGGFNGMGWNGMPNMMANGNWNGMNPMDFNNMNGMPNGMYGNFGGNMGMGMNDMSAMNMMQYGGGYGNGWNGMGGGYGNFSGPNQMGGYNQSGAYPEMMNQFPKHNFPNQNQNRFHANQGGAHPQRNNRNGSQGGFGPGFQGANNRPDSRGGPSQNVRSTQYRFPPNPYKRGGKTWKTQTNAISHTQRDGQSPDGIADTAPEAKAEGEQEKTSAEPTEEGKENVGTVPNSTEAQNPEAGSGVDASQAAGEDTNETGDGPDGATQDGGLKPIQTVDTGSADMQDYDQSMMGNGMHVNMPYPQGMMNQFAAGHLNAPFDPNMNMNMNMGYNGNYGPRGGFNNGAYGAATILTGQPAEPIGVGVKGAPTGPRAMREGRPNTGFSSRVNSGRYAPPPPPKSVASTQDAAAPGSPQRRVRSQSPLRDESMRVNKRSPTRSRSRSRARGEVREEQRERSRSADRHSRRDDRGRSVTPLEDDYDSRKERKHHRSSRYDDREQEHDDRYRDEKSSRGDRTRTASADSKYRSSRRDKDKHRSSKSHRDRSREHRRRHRSRSPRAEDKYEDDDAYANGEKDSDSSSRRKHRSGDKDRHRDRSREKDRERDRKERKERDRDYDYDREKDRSRDKDKERRRRRDREAEDDDRDYEDEKYRSSRRSRKDRDRERRDYDDRDRKEKLSVPEKEEDVVGKMMKKRAVSPPLNAPTGPSANGFSIKGRSKNVMAPPAQPPTGPRAFQPPKGPAADRNKDRSESKDNRRKSSVSSIPSIPAGPAAKEKESSQDHYAAERERNARERDSRERVEKPIAKSLHSRISSSSSTSRPSLSTKRSRDDFDDEAAVPKGPKADVKPPTGPASHRDKRRKSGTTGDDNIANLFTAGLRKNAKARRGGVRTEGDVEREMVERERERR